MLDIAELFSHIPDLDDRSDELENEPLSEKKKNLPKPKKKARKKKQTRRKYQGYTVGKHVLFEDLFDLNLASREQEDKVIADLPFDVKKAPVSWNKEVPKKKDNRTRKRKSNQRAPSRKKRKTDVKVKPKLEEAKQRSSKRDRKSVASKTRKNKVEKKKIPKRNRKSRKKSFVKKKVSKYIGVTWHVRKRQWLCRVKWKKGYKFIGYFDSEEKAARKHDEQARILHGSNITGVKLNFKIDTQEHKPLFHGIHYNSRKHNYYAMVKIDGKDKWAGSHADQYQLLEKLKEKCQKWRSEGKQVHPENVGTPRDGPQETSTGKEKKVKTKANRSKIKNVPKPKKYVKVAKEEPVLNDEEVKCQKNIPKESIRTKSENKDITNKCESEESNQTQEQPIFDSPGFSIKPKKTKRDKKPTSPKKLSPPTYSRSNSRRSSRQSSSRLDSSSDGRSQSGRLITGYKEVKKLSDKFHQVLIVKKPSPGSFTFAFNGPNTAIRQLRKLNFKIYPGGIQKCVKGEIDNLDGLTFKWHKFSYNKKVKWNILIEKTRKRVHERAKKLKGRGGLGKKKTSKDTVKKTGKPPSEKSYHSHPPALRRSNSHRKPNLKGVKKKTLARFYGGLSSLWKK